MKLELKRSDYEVDGSMLSKDNKLIAFTAYIPQILVTMNDHFINELKSKKQAYVLMTNLYNEENQIKEMKINKIIPASSNYVKHAVVGSSYISNSTNLILDIDNLVDPRKINKLYPNYIHGTVIHKDKENKIVYPTDNQLNVYIPEAHRKDNIHPNDYVKVLQPLGKDKYQQVICRVDTIDHINRHQKQGDSLFKKCLLNNNLF